MSLFPSELDANKEAVSTPVDGNLANGRLAYIMSRFPHLPETFILREMSEMKRLGWQVSLYPLIRQKQTVTHPQTSEWIQRAVFVPLFSTAVLNANLRRLVQNPRKYIHLWMRVIGENASDMNLLPRAVALLPKTIYLADLMVQNGVTRIHAHYATHPALAAWAIHYLTGIPYSVTVHAHDIFVRQAMLPTKLRGADFVVAISEFNRRFLIKMMGSWIDEKIHVIHCGIQPEQYALSVERQADRAEFEILNVGSLQSYKGHTVLIDACAMLRERGIPFRCRIIGGGSQNELHRQIKRLDLEGNVELLGPRDEQIVAHYLLNADCYVQPSVITASGKMEGIPVSIMEALASGLPVVATNLSGVPELVQPGKTGFLVPPGDSGALADALEYVYCHPTVAAAFAAAGRELVLAEFNLQTNVFRLSNLLWGQLEKQDRSIGQAKRVGVFR